MKDSCYRDYGAFEIRISNHSAEYNHDIQNGYLIVNIKGSMKMRQESTDSQSVEECPSLVPYGTIFLFNVSF